MNNELMLQAEIIMRQKEVKKLGHKNIKTPATKRERTLSFFLLGHMSKETTNIAIGSENELIFDEIKNL